MALNSSCDVLAKIVEKLRGQHLQTGHGPGPTLNPPGLSDLQYQALYGTFLS